ncbi:MAG: hypothetical protein BWY10_00669 [Chloroflexi bacterium ADurb.Bin180]|nr:MAG: hypothetical protein BWY10_00669 [Chloroflexi bacterium ADurb.Bin180]HNR96274.1 DUF4416 family protein [Anaerolineae bacterium]HNT04984.1 DUF4416 family protein [Anaerolineae bacterium]HQJ50773.1 DUF4416 family protein [Anaerolineae bacterium]
MGKAREPAPVKLIVSVFTRDVTMLAVARGALGGLFGPVDYRSETLPFDNTSYYEREFGPNLVREILAFSTLIAPQELASVKLKTNELERTWRVDSKRVVNLDPGYVTLGKLVLATTKDYSHRIYLGEGIYGEVTLKYEHGAFRAWEWTYPDYASAEYRAIFAAIRQLYAEQLRQESAG